MSEEPPDVEPMVLANRYRLERRLGQGGMSEVWLATDIALDRRVAVKWLKPTLATDMVVAERFRREAIAVARLNHPNIVAVHDAFEHDGRQAVVMQLVDGKSLRQLLDVQTRLSPELTIHIGSCVAAALDSAHRAGFVHRDVKPGNIMITADGRVMLTDFGIAKGLDSADDDLTSDNVMMGTAKYLSPEQVRGKRLDGRADLYSLGLVLYECLAGRVPFLGETDADTALARLQRDPTDLGQLRPTLPRGLVVLIHRLLARNPNHRPRDGDELRAALADVANEPPPHIDSTPAEPAPRLQSPVRPVRPVRAPSPEPPARTSPPAAEPIPGEVAAHGTTSQVAITDGPRTGEGADAPSARADTPAAASSAARDSTPRANEPIRGRPARGLQQRYMPSLIVVVALLVVAALVALVLWFMLRTDDDNPDGAGAENPATGSTAIDRTTVPTGPAGVASVVAYDSSGASGTTDDQASEALADGDDSTTWPTECYADRWMGAKDGVGVVVELDRPASGTIAFDVLSAPYQVDVYASNGDNAPVGLDGWGESLAADEWGTEPGSVSVSTGDRPVAFVLVLLTELGPDSACSGANPYRGLLGEISFTP